MVVDALNVTSAAAEEIVGQWQLRFMQVDPHPGGAPDLVRNRRERGSCLEAKTSPAPPARQQSGQRPSEGELRRGR